MMPADMFPLSGECLSYEISKVPESYGSLITVMITILENNSYNHIEVNPISTFGDKSYKTW